MSDELSDEKNVISTPKKDTAENQDKSQATPKPLPNVKIEQRPANENCSTKKATNTFKKWKRWCGYFFRFIELCALIAAIITAWVIYKQLQEMQTDRNLDERAWIGVQNVGLILPYSAEHIGLHVTTINTGRTPATIEDEDILVGTVYGESTNVNIIIEKHLAGLIATPGQAYPISINQPLPGRTNGFALLVEKKMKVYFFLKIRYRDTFNIVRHTETGYIVTGHQDDVGGEGGIIPPIPNFGTMD